ncbi:MAG: UDP-GlcNAc--UDP-phosphate GlcNAc-phosphate transferase [Mucilaginibacter sp.]|uniref:UDP-GlcNAc--UDP-phosphate GlcNAc-1-phosphate transferase n=1 Tax=Mucilaginibacter sp. TaxID=1882438 RepID=UPI002603EB68|nr:UDP-GlcNAc--UDP-phosphate GlcNAc-1-phosphate transferase [Mucilaginibacter sp.]MDB5002315.1 UDP-GlcNAc--UDP-phosphate GlcNAc-phosphate transferase [Mucilaginibacter sp.]
MDLFILFIFFCVLFALELIYFKIADKYNIIDHPNHRSSHTKVTLRGGGIIFTIGFLLGSFYLHWEYGYFLIGLLLISLISFIDDIKHTSKRIRILVHLIAVALLFYQSGMYNFPIYWIFLGFALVIGSINAINFMDGINGITGGFGLLTLITLYFINKHILFTDEKQLVIGIIALLVFNFFNFRAKAKCFAGDVGSVSLAFIILFFLLQLIIKTSNLNYLLILLVYGLDTVTTIIFRTLRKEDIFKAHRSHFYQFWANEKKIPHLIVAMAYIVVQGIIDFILVKFNPASIVNLIISVVITAIIFILMRIHFEGSNKLFNIKKTY